MFEFAKRDLVEEDCGLGVNALVVRHATSWSRLFRLFGLSLSCGETVLYAESALQRSWVSWRRVASDCELGSCGSIPVVMLDLDLAVLDAHPEWRQVLLAYGDELETATPADAETADFLARGFRPRVREVEGVPADQMARVHGKLIAHGLLQVEIAGRTGGMLYQLTTLGRRACVRLADSVEESAMELASA